MGGVRGVMGLGTGVMCIDGHPYYLSPNYTRVLETKKHTIQKHTHIFYIPPYWRSPGPRRTWPGPAAGSAHGTPT